MEWAMKIEYYSVYRKREHFYRWRIVAPDRRIIAQGVTFHRLRDDAQREVDEVLEFLEAWSRERMQFGGV